MPLPGPEKSLLRYRGKASAELTCYADLEVYSTPAPTVHIAQQQPARQTVAASSSLCHSCNIAAQTPKTIPVVFHNGGGYDFHFLLRYIATMGSPVSRAPREELGKDSDNEGTESEAEGSEVERPMPMAKAAPKPKAKAKAAPRPPCRPRSSRATTATSASESSVCR